MSLFTRRALVSALGAALLPLATATAWAQNVKLTVAASPVPHAEILEHLKPRLAQQGVDLEVKVFNDYVQPNVQVEEKHLDANYFQHVPYLETFNKSRGTHLVVVGQPVHIEPFAGYSVKHKKLADLPDGATVALPNDPTNGGRALLLLAANGLITLKDPANILATPKDVVANPKHLKFRELEAATLPRVLPQVDLALINTNYALEAKLSPAKDALFIEKTSPYANVLVARPDNQNSAALKKLDAALHSAETRKFIEQKYQGAVVPAF